MQLTFGAATSRVPSMTPSAKQLNLAYLAKMRSADEARAGQKGLARIRDSWWPSFEERCASEGAAPTLDSLDVCMDAGRTRLYELAGRHAHDSGHTAGGQKHTQVVNQFLKSNTGKMFERFAGLALARALIALDAPFCVTPFTDEWLANCGLKRNDFLVAVDLGKEHLVTPIDADLVAFRPDDPTAPVYQLSMKSTLKDRFHNVPFWNLLRISALSGQHNHISAWNPDVLARAQYVAICSDLADEQPDFMADAGPRNLLRLDAALLDGAFVTASRARGVSRGSPCLGRNRAAAFHWLSQFAETLASDERPTPLAA
jgi:hypothetical protein